MKQVTVLFSFKCTPYEYLGDDTEVETFVRQNYIRVSRIISGKTASDLGNVAQQYVVEYLTTTLGEELLREKQRYNSGCHSK